MGTYVKKPVAIEAVRFDGHEWEDDDTLKPMFEGSFDVIPEWLVDAMAKGEKEPGAVFTVSSAQATPDTAQLSIVTLEGTMQATPGDYIIRGVAGELYPCKPEIFLASYDGPVSVGRTELEGRASA